MAVKNAAKRTHLSRVVFGSLLEEGASGGLDRKSELEMVPIFFFTVSEFEFV